MATLHNNLGTHQKIPRINVLILWRRERNHLKPVQEKGKRLHESVVKEFCSVVGCLCTRPNYTPVESNAVSSPHVATVHGWFDTLWHPPGGLRSKTRSFREGFKFEMRWSIWSICKYQKISTAQKFLRQNQQANTLECVWAFEFPELALAIVFPLPIKVPYFVCLCSILFSSPCSFFLLLFASFPLLLLLFYFILPIGLLSVAVVINDETVSHNWKHFGSYSCGLWVVWFYIWNGSSRLHEHTVWNCRALSETRWGQSSPEHCVPTGRWFILYKATKRTLHPCEPDFRMDPPGGGKSCQQVWKGRDEDHSEHFLIYSKTTSADSATFLN